MDTLIIITLFVLGLLIISITLTIISIFRKPKVIEEFPNITLIVTCEDGDEQTEDVSIYDFSKIDKNIVGITYFFTEEEKKEVDMLKHIIIPNVKIFKYKDGTFSWKRDYSYGLSQDFLF